MLNNVPVARILAFLFLISAVLIGWVAYEGYRTASGVLNAGVHIRFALFGIVVVLFTQTMTLFYFVGTGSRIRKVVQERSLTPDYVRRTISLKGRLFPWLTFTPLATMAAFILGGGAHTRVLPGWVHGATALLALAMNLVTAAIAIVCIGDNMSLIDEIDDALDAEGQASA